MRGCRFATLDVENTTFECVRSGGETLHLVTAGVLLVTMHHHNIVFLACGGDHRILSGL